MISKRMVAVVIAMDLCLTVPAIGEDVFAMSGDSLSLEFVPILNPGNAADTTGRGSVAYSYAIGTYEVTTAQYTQFLNAVAVTDTYLLYNSYMSGPGYDVEGFGGCEIVQSGSDGNYSYSVTPDRANRPVNYVGWGDAARFVNWLHNDQPTGLQGAGTTETGAYNLNGAVTNAELMDVSITRQAGAKYMLPSEDEWYKAAYHDPVSPGADANGTDDYWIYPTGSDRYPVNPSYGVWDLNARDLDAEYGPYNAATFMGQGYYPDGRTGDGHWTSEVDFWDLSESPYGTLNQGGNLAEWTEDAGFTDLPVSPGRVIRGGSYDIGYQEMRSDHYEVLTPWDPGDEDENPIWLWAGDPDIYLGSYDYRSTGIRVARARVPVPGDVNDDGEINGKDIDLMAEYIRTGIAPTAGNYDLSANGTTGGADGDIDLDDLDYLVRYLVETTAVDGDGNPIFGTQYGDFNLDGEIELADLTRLGTYYGVGSTWAEGNANGYLDLDIELGDLTTLGTYYGASNGGVDAIPEPMTFLLMGCGAIGLLRRGGSKNCRRRRA